MRKGSLKVDGYAVAELVARADAVASGLGGPVGELVALAGELTGPGAAQLSFDQIEQQVIVRGREILRLTVQHVMDARAVAEPRRAEVTRANGVPRTRVERGHARTVLTWFGPVIVRRMAYRAPGAPNLHPADAALSLPARRYSWAVVLRNSLAASGGDGDGQELRRPDFLRDRLTVGLEARDVNLDGLHGPLAALLNRAAPGKAPGQGWHGHEVAAVRLGLYHDRVGTHQFHPVIADAVVHGRPDSRTTVLDRALAANVAPDGARFLPQTRGLDEAACCFRLSHGAWI